MRKLTIAFDVDGTLISNTRTTSNGLPIANERIRSLLIILSTFKNVKIIVWSGGGELYARQMAMGLGITDYVDGYYSKNPQRTVGKTETETRHVFSLDIVPDIAIDDIEDCDLGVLNLIVKEK